MADLDSLLGMIATEAFEGSTGGCEDYGHIFPNPPFLPEVSRREDAPDLPKLHYRLRLEFNPETETWDWRED